MLKKLRNKWDAYTAHFRGNCRIAWHHIRHGTAHLIHGLLPFVPLSHGDE
ncbi:hypothetical protein [Sporomusa sp. KB1]|nr:hypothetical protein [Sporomusa sp. KB1]